jgi:hypothetical protein
MPLKEPVSGIDREKDQQKGDLFTERCLIADDEPGKNDQKHEYRDQQRGHQAHLLEGLYYTQARLIYKRAFDAAID